MSKENRDLVVALDIGTSKIAMLAARVTPDGQPEIIGFDAQDSAGLKKGVVVNIEEAVGAISRTVRAVELMADCRVKEVYTGIAGSHIKSFDTDGMVAVKSKEITEGDVRRAIDTARAQSIPAGHEILHVIPQEFLIDGQEGIREPIGMSGCRLEVKAHMVTGNVSAVQNLVKCVRHAGLEPVEIILQPLASSRAVLTDDERELGVCLIDIGGGTTDIAVWTKGAIRHTSVIPVAGDLITSDIAQVLRTSSRDAEDIKLRYGLAQADHASPEDMLEVAGIDDRPSRSLSRRALADVIQPRIEELYELVYQDLADHGFVDVLSSGLVLTGGASLMPGMAELCEEMFRVPVRVGVPRYKGNAHEMIQTPRYATAFGLIEEALTQYRRGVKPDAAPKGPGLWGHVRTFFSHF
jgi:cell division protein FtsA